MALSPLKKPKDERVLKRTRKLRPSQTYSFDFDTGLFGEPIDGIAALRQFIRKAIATPRFRYLIYNGQYGCEIEKLIGQDLPLPLLQSEISRLIREALIYDDRIKDVHSFAFLREPESDAIYVSFTVASALGTIHEEVAV